ncbi:MAG: right-handed parallel beta-helix repeat-containing protein [Cyanobacteria bacterium SZAS LIN-2]|nr:right-handed parallel beta-helix repeat-containing protein [Cyanobacteria bacterium SZAS LIN-2]
MDCGRGQGRHGGGHHRAQEQASTDCAADYLPPLTLADSDDCSSDCSSDYSPDSSPSIPSDLPPSIPSDIPSTLPANNVGDGQVGVVGDQPPRSDVPLEGGRQAIVISGDNIPAEIAQYARFENGRLIIDAGGHEIPPLRIERNDVSVLNARISASGEPDILISGARNVTVSGCEITGGTTGIKADHASNITVSGNYIHDMSYENRFDTSAVEFDSVSGGTIEGNKITGDEAHPFRSDAISMFESQDLRVFNNTLSVVIEEPSSSPLMVEGSTSNNIEVAYNDITYRGGANVPPGLLGGTNISGHDNIVNGDTSKAAWQLYAYNDVWQYIYYNGERIS